MPSKFIAKEFVNGGIYHIYNRGIDGRKLFTEDNDYQELVNLMKRYLAEYKDPEVKPGFKAERLYVRRRKRDMNLSGEVEMWAYCLLDDHLHFLVRQVSVDGVTKFMRRLMTGYVMYYNKKFQRKGGLFEGVYRGVGIESMESVLELSKFLHQHGSKQTRRKFGPVETVTGVRPEDYLFSSYRDYLGQGEGWVVRDPILNLVGGGENYRKLVEETRVDVGKFDGLNFD